MNTRPLALLGLVLGISAVLGSLTLSYGLVHVSARVGTRTPLVLAVALGAAAAALAAVFSLRSARRSASESERFFALLSLVLSAFFLFVIVLGYGLPQLFLRPED
jgi:hypothetical protein